MHPLAIASVDAWPLDVPLAGEFAISRGSVAVARNAVVRVALAGGSEGFGEIAPFEELTGESRSGALGAIETLREAAIGRVAGEWRSLAAQWAEREPHHPSARAGLEAAVLDAFARALGAPLWAIWGGADVRVRETDVTIPLVEEEQALALARAWRARGFRQLKLKVGADPDADVRRVRRMADAVPDASFILDANQGYDVEGATAFALALAGLRARIVFFEQPVARDDLEGMAEVRARGGLPVAADESVQSAAEAVAVVRMGAADCINLKVMKSGVLGVLEVAAVARAAGLRLMIGGMIETRLAMGFSQSIALGVGGVDVLDLDTPLLLAADPMHGGYLYEGPRLTVCGDPGLGMRPRAIP